MIDSVRFLVFSVALIATASTAIAGAVPKSQSHSEAVKAGGASSGDAKLIDINSATLTDLKSLPGVGAAYARKIVEGRPYASVDDLKARKVLSSGTYDKIRDRISAKGHPKAVAGEKPGAATPGSGMH
ncbi:MAG TPA: helix-hairpin-helix domain-containing protein [Nitrospira sp.]|nr:helix-hairpin-helix domain-containing protein [Nitrospira sp.]